MRAPLAAAWAILTVWCATIGGQTPTPAGSAAKLSRDWRRVAAPGLTVLGNASAGDLRKTTQEILRFRAAMRGLLPAIRMEPPAPTVAVVFRDDGALTPFKPRDHGRPMDTVGAYFTSQPDVNYIVMAMGRREYTYHVIFHEYTHLLVNQNIRRLPVWLNEGMADLFGTFDGDEHDGRLIVGRPMPDYVRLLAGTNGVLVPLKKFMDPQGNPDVYRDGLSTLKFYAQSWALTHYLFFGDKGTHQPQLGAFMSALQAGDPPDVVFKRIFGEDFGPMDAALRQYVNLMQLPAMQVPPPAIDLPPEAQSITEAEAEQIQADLLERQGAFDESKTHLDKALALDPDSVAAQLTRARSLVGQDKADEALTQLATPALAARDDFATVFVRAVANQTAKNFEAAEAAYKRTVTLRPDAPYTYYGLSIAQLALNRPESAASFSRVLLLQPGAGWFYSRLLDGQRLGIDRFALADAISYVNQNGWQNPITTAYVKYIEAIALLRTHEPDQAAISLNEVLAHVPPTSWQASVAQFLEGKLTGSALLSKANSTGLQTEAHAYIGIKANIDGDKAVALEHLQWVKAKGDHGYTEYRLALGELDRMDRVH